MSDTHLIMKKLEGIEEKLEEMADVLDVLREDTETDTQEEEEEEEDSESGEEELPPAEEEVEAPRIVKSGQKVSREEMRVLNKPKKKPEPKEEEEEDDSEEKWDDNDFRE